MMVLNHPSTRRSYKRRLTCSVISVIIALSLTAGAAQAQARTQPTESARALSIPAGQLDTSIIELARTTGISIFVPPALVAGKRAGAVNGVMSPEQALVRLLKGTGVTFRRGADGGYVLVGQQSRPVSRAAQPIIAPKRGVVDAQLADESSDQVGGGEIVVTARRREESALDVPIAVAALSSTQLERSGANTLVDVGKLVPGLVVSTTTAGFGGSIVLRGIGSGTNSPAIEQAVTVNVDGVPISYGGVVKLGYLDLEQIEVLKGPQALFFGKNATGGIVALKSADPADRFKAMGRAGYEFNAREYFLEGMVTGPLTDNLGARLAVRYSNSRGYFHNILTDNAGAAGVFVPTKHYGPGDSEFAIRGTLKFEPTSELALRLKVAHTNGTSNGSNSTAQFTFCPYGSPQGFINSSGLNECKIDSNYSHGDISPLIAALDPRMGDGAPHKTLQQNLFILDGSYAFSEGLTLTSSTAYYDMKQVNVDEYSYAPQSAYGAVNGIRKKQFTQEVRLTSEFDGPINGMLGVFFQNDKFNDRTRISAILGSGSLIAFPGYDSTIQDETFSAFGQLRWNILDDLELSGGARYTHERKSVTASIFTSGKDVTDKINPNSIVADDVSPEATLAYHPARNSTLYISYKQGFKAGGFQFTGSTVPSGLDSGKTLDLAYYNEGISGFEVGAKGLLFDGQLRANLAAYRYHLKDLQLSKYDPLTLSNSVANISGAVNKGAELDVRFSPRELRNLTLTGSVAYNSTKYDRFYAACYVGQTIAEGCNVLDLEGTLITPEQYTLDPSKRPGLQDLTGTRLPRAPAWVGSIGVSYEVPLGSSLRLGLDGGASFRSKTVISQESAPGQTWPSYWMTNAAISLGAQDDSWEFSLSGRNLMDKHVSDYGIQATFTGDSTRTGTNADGGHPDIVSYIQRPREIWARLTVRY